MTVGELIEYLKQFDENKKVLGYQLDNEGEGDYDGSGLLFNPYFFKQEELLDEDGNFLEQEQADGIILLITNIYKDGTEDYLTSAEPTDESPRW